MIVMIVVMMVITTTNSGLLITRRNQSGLEADYHLHTIQLRSIKNTIQSKYSPFFFNINHDLDSNIFFHTIQFGFSPFFNIHLDWDDYIFRLVSELISNYCHFQF